jgi:hypothetical protein
VGYGNYINRTVDRTLTAVCKARASLGSGQAINSH